MVKITQKYILLLVIIFGSIGLMFRGSWAAALTAQLVVNPNRTEVFAGSNRIALTTKAAGTQLTFKWELQGPGKLEGRGPAVFYLPPETIEKDSELAKITVTVTDKTGQESTETVTFKILAPPPSTPHLTPERPDSGSDR